MKRPAYMPLAIAEFLVWLENFGAKFLIHASTLGLSSETSSVTLDLNFVRFVVNNTEGQGQRLSDTISMKNLLIDGPIGLSPLAYPGPAPLVGLTPPPVGAPPGTPGTVPTAVASGVVERIAGTVRRILAAAAYNEGIGRDLGITNAAPGSVDLLLLKPSISLLHSATKVLVKWTRARGTDALRIEADYGTGTFVRVIDDTRPDHLDDHPAPTSGQAALWKYRAIYLKDGQPVGNYSDVVSITVTGM